MNESQVAVFMDFENVALSAEDIYGKCDLGLIMTVVEQWGHATIRRAYGDWTDFNQYQQDLLNHSFELLQLFRYSPQHRKNAADIQMAVDAVEIAFTHPEVSTFVLITGDSDFSAVARKLRTYGKQIMGIGLRQSTSEVLVKACDQFILYDTLVKDTRTSVYRLEQARQLLQDAMRMLRPQVGGDTVNASQLKMMMLKLDPTFNESDVGYPQFRNFLESQSDLVTTQVRDQVLWVTLKPTALAKPTEEDLVQYRLALNTAGLHLLDPHTRTDILLDFYDLFSEAPGTYTLNQAVTQLKASYDAGNVLRSREEVQEVSKLLKYTDVFEPQPQSWREDPLTLKANLPAQTFVDLCESAYLITLIHHNLELHPDMLAQLLFGTLDQRARVVHLTALAIRARTAEFQTEAPPQEPFTTGACYLRDTPHLQRVLEDLAATEPEERPSLEKAARLHQKGLRIRLTDYEQARAYFIQAARMMCDLIQMEEQGTSRTELEWYLASYCAASAGAYYFRQNYEPAQAYYLAFFALADETRPTWEKLAGLIEPLLSFYFNIAAETEDVLLELHPGRTPSAKMALALYTHPHNAVREHWLALVKKLYNVNPAIVRGVQRRLKSMTQTLNSPEAQATYVALEKLRRN